MGIDIFPAPGASRASVRGMANLWEFGNLYTPKGFSLACELAARQVSGRGRGSVFVPPSDLSGGAWVAGVPDANEVATDEGTAVMLTAAHSNVSFFGAHGQTLIRPPSNRIAVFEGDGATDISFEGIIFDNSDNGPLQNQVKGVTKLPGSGVAGWGNGANCAIRQYTGAGLKVRNCKFIDFMGCVTYYGNYLDIDELVGTVDFQHNELDGCGFGLLTQQPEHAICNDNAWLNAIDSILSTGAKDPGHLFYNANTAGADPLTVTLIGNRWNNIKSSAIKARKGIQRTIVGNVGTGHRGIECHGGETLTITGNDCTITDVTPGVDANQAALEISGARIGGTITGNTLRRKAAKGWCLRIRIADVDPDAEDAAGEYPRNLLFADNTMICDGAGTIIKPFATIRGATDLDLVNNTARHIHADGLVVNAIDEYVFDVDGSTRVRAVNNARRTAAVGNPTGSHRLVFFGTGCVGCSATFRRQDLDAVPTSGTIGGGGDYKTLRNDAVERGTWTPTFAFATPGNTPATITVNSGPTVCRYERSGPSMVAFGNVSITTNAYDGSAAGDLQMSGLPGAPGRIGDALGTLAQHQNIVGTTGTDFAVKLPKDASIAGFRRSIIGGTGGSMTVTNFPASTTFVFSFRLEYLTDET